MVKRIKIGVTALSFHRTTTSLITNVLKTMGFEVEQVFSSHQENFEKLKTGRDLTERVEKYPFTTPLSRVVIKYSLNTMKRLGGLSGVKLSRLNVSNQRRMNNVTNNNESNWFYSITCD